MNRTTHKLHKGTDVIGLKVISLIDGKELQPVNDIIYDPQINKIAALLVDKGGWFSDARVIAIEDVKSIGEDAVIIESEELIRPASSISQRIANIAREDINLTKTRIITDKGTDLGTVTDIFFDDAGIVDEFEVSQGVLKSLQSGNKRIKVTDIITIGQDATIVREETKDFLEEQAKYQGVQGMVTTTQEKTGQAWESAKQKTTELGQQVRDKTNELGGQAKAKYEETKSDPKTQDMLSTLQEKNMEFMETIEEKTDQIKEGLKDMWQQGKEKTYELKEDQDVKATAHNIKIASEDAAQKGKDTLSDKVREAKQIARRKTQQIRADMEVEEDQMQPTTPYMAETSDYTTTAGMKGGRSKTSGKKTK